MILLNWLNENQGAIMAIQGTVMATLTLVYVITTIIIVCSNRKLRKQDIKLAFFDRRIKLYNYVKEFINSVISNQACSILDVSTFHSNCIDANFLFDKGVNDYIEKLRVNGNRLASIIENEMIRRGTVIENLRSDKYDEKKIVSDEKQELLEWFTEQQSIVVERFDTYLNVNKLGL